MGFLKKLFGDKASRDNKALQPILQKTLKAYEQIVKLDIDSLRHKTVEFKEYIKNKTAAEVAEGRSQLRHGPRREGETLQPNR